MQNMYSKEIIRKAQGKMHFQKKFGHKTGSEMRNWINIKLTVLSNSNVISLKAFFPPKRQTLAVSHL